MLFELRFAVVYRDDSWVNAQYRALIPANVLARRGHELVWCGPSTERLPLAQLRRCDLVHVYRASDPGLIRALRELRDSGVAVSWDNDDDATAIPRESPTYRRHGGLAAQRDHVWQVRAIRLADLVTTPNDILADKYRDAGGRHVVVIDNYLPRDFLRGRRPRHEGIVVGWTGGLEHRADARLLSLERVLLRTLEQHAHVRVVTVGVRLELMHDRYERRRAVEFQRLVRIIREFDIGLVPLADIPFNRARSTIKAKEYGAGGAPWLASPVGQYAGLGPKQGGRLVADDEWYDALDRLIRNRGERTRLGLRARLWAHQQAIHHNVYIWEREFKAAIDRVRDGSTTITATATASAG